MTCYELKDGDYWMVRFFVVKDLNALLTVMLVSFAVCYIICNIVLVFRKKF